MQSQNIVHRVSWAYLSQKGKPGKSSNIHLISHEDYYKPNEPSKALCSRVVPPTPDNTDWGLGWRQCERCYAIADKRGLEIDE